MQDWYQQDVLYRLLHGLPEMIQWYLFELVLPLTMEFQVRAPAACLCALLVFSPGRTFPSQAAFEIKGAFPAGLCSLWQAARLSSSGQELGGDLIFKSRMAFSGTPSDLLPKELGSCVYEKVRYPPKL